MSANFEPPSTMRGLSETEAAARLAAEGFNELPQADRRTLLRIILEVLREPMLALLIAAGCVYLALGDIKEAIVLLAFACLSVVITVVQETRTESVLEALRDLTSPRALVIRDGERQRIAGREVVRGDLVVLAEGDRVPADLRLLEAGDLLADELLLTGESAAVRKIPTENSPVRVAPRRRGSALHLFRNPDRPRRRRRRGFRHGRVQRDRQDRQVARGDRDRDAAPAKADTQVGRHFRTVRRCRQRSGRRPLHRLARRLAGGPARGNSGGHVHAAGRVPCRADSLPGHGRLAHLAGSGSDPARHGHRGAGHAPPASPNWSPTACSPARRSRSIRWRRRFKPWPAKQIQPPARMGRWSEFTRCGPTCWQSHMSGAGPGRPRRSGRFQQRAPPKPSPSFAGMEASSARRWRRLSTKWRRRG